MTTLATRIPIGVMLILSLMLLRHLQEELDGRAVSALCLIVKAKQRP
jgi:hypothetical protein